MASAFVGMRAALNITETAIDIVVERYWGFILMSVTVKKAIGGALFETETLLFGGGSHLTEVDCLDHWRGGGEKLGPGHLNFNDYWIFNY